MTTTAGLLGRGAVIAIGLSGGLAFAFARVDRWPEPPGPSPRVAAAYSMPTAPNLDSIVRVAVAGNPMRPDRTPSESRYGLAAQEPRTPRPEGPAPVIHLHGILQGATPMAIISFGDNPSHALVREGGATNGVTLRSVRTAQIEVEWADSVWTVAVSGGES